jgi:hypothetical protein
VSATNIAFRPADWPGYAVHFTQGGDELDLLRGLRVAGGWSTTTGARA